MTKLTKVVREDVGRSSDEMRMFFQSMVSDRRLNAYLVQIDNERIARRDEGAALTPTTQLPVYGDVTCVVEDPATRFLYFLTIGSRGGILFNDGDAQTMYDRCVLARIAQGFDPKVTKRIPFPSTRATPSVSVDYQVDFRSGGDCDYVAGTRGSLVVEGEQDSLVDRVRRFVKYAVIPTACSD